MKLKKSKIGHIKHLIFAIFSLFLYVFSFRLLGSITSSYLCPLFIASFLLSKKGRCNFWSLINDKYIKGIFIFQVALISLGLLYSLTHQTYDLSYISILFAQIIHLILGLFCIFYLYFVCKFSYKEVIYLVIIIYIIQSFIEISASAVPAIASFVAKFNHAEDMQMGYGGVRGLALSSGTTWPLSLTYGLVFFFYTKVILEKRISLLTVSGWLVLVIGTFFAGRTGLVGACISLVYLMVYTRQSIIRKISFFGWIICVSFFSLACLYIFSPLYYEFLFTKILPFALAPIENYLKGRGFTTNSTEDLETMWNRPMTDGEFFFGTGYFTGTDGAYYLHTDVGVLRNLFYWGIFCYLILIAYQIYLLWPIIKTKGYVIIMSFAIFYIAAAEYKAVTVGINKMLFSVIIIIAFFCNKNKYGIDNNSMLQCSQNHNTDS